MNAIAAAVIGGTSLFGGRGKTWSALLGALVIQSIITGLDLQGLSQTIQFMVTGAVLLAAVVIDSVSRRTQKSAAAADTAPGPGTHSLARGSRRPGLRTPGRCRPPAALVRRVRTDAASRSSSWRPLDQVLLEKYLTRRNGWHC